MRRLAINFAGELDKRRVSRVTLPVALAGAAAIVLLGVFSWQLASLEKRHADVRARIELATQASHARQARAGSKPQISRDAAVAVNQAVRQLNLPWSQIFDTLERATPESIAVLSLTPEARSATLTVVGESQHTDSMLAYVRQLKAEPLFEDVSVARHEINDKDPHKPVRFELAARWRPQQ